jgi:hypothetical protein
MASECPSRKSAPVTDSEGSGCRRVEAKNWLLGFPRRFDDGSPTRSRVHDTNESRSCGAATGENRLHYGSFEDELA